MKKNRIKVVTWLTAFALAVPMMPTKKLNATSNVGGDIQQFPESYRAKLQALKQAHPSWSFEPLYTNLDWNDALTQEYDGDKCLVWAQASDILKSNAKGDYNSTSGSYVYKDSSHWVKTTKDVTAYFMDPRNWLNEDNVFMFEDISANGQTLSGVQSIIAGSFMDGNYADVVDDTEEETTTEKKEKKKKTKKKDTASIEPISRVLLSASENEDDASNSSSKEEEGKVTEKQEITTQEETTTKQEAETNTVNAVTEKKSTTEKKTTKKSQKGYSDDDVEADFDDDEDDFEEETKKKIKKKKNETDEDETTEKETKKQNKNKKKGTITYAEAIYQAGMSANVNPY